MTSNFSLYCDAVLIDGCSVLKQVVTMLYQGGNLRPDFYFEHIGKEKIYNKVFPKKQRQRIIESSEDPHGYDIKRGVKNYDVSILSYLVEHTCGLQSSEILVEKVIKVRSSRNDVCHSQGEVSLTKSELCEELDKLLEWYIMILENLESKTDRDFRFEKTQIKRKIEQKKLMAEDSPSTSSDAVTTLVEPNPVEESYTPLPSTSVKHTATSPVQSYNVKESYIAPTPSWTSYSSKRPDFETAYNGRRPDFETAYNSRRPDFETAYNSRRSDFETAYNSRRPDFETAYNSRRPDFETAYNSRRPDFETAYNSRRPDFETAYNSRRPDFETAYNTRRSDFETAYNTRRSDFETAYNTRRPAFDDNPYLAYSASPRATESDSGIPTWGKVALGVTAGIATLGIVRAAATRDEEQSKQKKHDQKGEECVVM